MNNAGYEIYSSFRYGLDEIVLGVCTERGVGKYVTWIHTPDKDDYCWGHYFNTEKMACKDFIERCESLISLIG